MNSVLFHIEWLLLVASLNAPAQNGQAAASPAQAIQLSSSPSTPAAAVAQASPAVSPANTIDADDDKDTPTPDIASQVRIVRLSQVRGVASIERNPGSGFAPAFANIPVVTGARLRTAKGVAEVEFEDGSTLRLTPDSEVDFSQLGRTAAGATVSQLSVRTGSVYVSLVRTKGSVFLLGSGKASMQLTPGSHVRLDVNETGIAPGTIGAAGVGTVAGALIQGVSTTANGEPNASLVVFDGEVDFGNAAGHTTVTRKRTLNFSTASGLAPVLDAHVDPAPFDQWDKEGVQYQKRYVNANGFAGSGYQFGASDLNYYGSFVNMPGCGSLWRPYFASAAWDPFDNGIWAWYGNAGYSWVSPYPWGWLPFHTGSWQSCGGGWGWRPGGAWYGLYNHPRLFYPGTLGVKHPPRPPHAPAPGQPRLIGVNQRPLPASGLTSVATFNFRKDSAGFGVPREGFHHLGHESSALERKGSARTELDLQRFYLPDTNHPAREAWAGTRRGDAAGSGAGQALADRSSRAVDHPGDRKGDHAADRAAWAASHHDAGALHAGEPAHVNEPRSNASAPGWSGSPRNAGGSAAPSPSYRSGPSPSAPSYHSAPSSGAAPSFHSAPPPTAASPSAGAPRGK